MRNLIFIIPAIEKEKEIIIKNIINLKFKLCKCRFETYKIILVYQTVNKFDIDISKLEDVRTKIIFKDFFSASKARNVGIRSVESSNNDYVMFLDSRVTLSENFILVTKKLILSDIYMWSGKIIWNEENEIDAVDKSDRKMVISNFPPYQIIRNTYLWSYVIKFNLIKGLYFNETIGISKENKLQGGEDILFFYDLITNKKVNNIISLPDCQIFHPERPKDYSKELLYAEAQGALYRHLFSRKMDINIKLFTTLYFILFAGNSLFRVLSFKKHSVLILRKRIKGFIKNEIEHQDEFLL